MLAHRSSGAALKLAHPLLPRSRLWGRHLHRTQRMVDDQLVEGLLAGDVVVDRHDWNAQFVRQRPHGDIVETRFVGELHRSLDDLLSRQ